MTETGKKATDNNAPEAYRTEGAGKAYQMVAQASAIAIQDAADNLRNFNAICNTALGVAMAQMLADPIHAAAYNDAVEKINALSVQATNNFKAIGECAANILKSFPSDR